MPREADNPVERHLENFLFSSRWLLAPIYVGLILSLVVILIAFAKKLFAFAAKAFVMGEAELILGVLSLIDLSLAANLLIIVVFSGYENFVSKINAAHHPDWPEWMGKVDFGGLKLKLLASIVALSAVQLLKAFMDIHKYSDRDLMWLMAIHGMFVVSGLILALTDKFAAASKKSSGAKKDV